MSSVSSTGGSTGGMYSTRLRITGSNSGIDVDGTVKKLMEAETVKLDKLKQDRQYNQWKQDGIRDIIKDLRALKDDYLSISSPADTNMIKSATYSGATVTAVDTNNPTSASVGVTAIALPGATTGVSTISVSQMAKSASAVGNVLNNTVPVGTIADWNGKTLKFSIPGTAVDTGVISVATDGSATEADLETAVNNAISSSNDLRGKVKATVSGGNISFSVLDSTSVKLISETGGTNKVSSILNKQLNPTMDTKLSDLQPGFTSTDFYIKQGTEVSSKITITGDDTMQTVAQKIYAAQSKDGFNDTYLSNDLKVSFSELTKQFTIETRNTGSAQTMQILGSKNPDGTYAAPNLGVLGLDGTQYQGKDAIVSITPVGSSTPITTTKSSNTFTIDNMTYTILKDPPLDSHGVPVPYSTTLTTKADSADAVKKIKGFVDKYNALVKKINDKISEKKNYDYKPLTDAQRSSMTDDQIKQWEDKAKQGILKNDGDLQDILYNLRSAVVDGITSAGLSLSDIGIQTYGSYESETKPGQLQIDETKLKTALETKGDQVLKAFTAVYSGMPPTPPAKGATDAQKAQYDADLAQYKKDYHNNTGVLNRITDIIRESSIAYNGSLLRKAGYEDTANETQNFISEDLRKQDQAIKDMIKKLADKEDSYYQKFSKLETALETLNSQQSALAQQLSK